MDPPPRLAPELPLPPCTYVPGYTPHPTRDPAGHLHGRAPATVAAPDPRRWRDDTTYLYGIDLFNHGFYWEAHEAWESLWHACGRVGPTADFLRALIRLAAAGFKVREGRATGCVRHAAAAAVTFEALVGVVGHRFMGLELPALAREAAAIAAGDASAMAPPAMARPGSAGRVFVRVLQPGD